MKFTLISADVTGAGLHTLQVNPIMALLNKICSETLMWKQNLGSKFQAAQGIDKIVFIESATFVPFPQWLSQIYIYTLSDEYLY